MADDVAYKQKKSFGDKVRDCRKGIWNGQKKELFGRNAASWGKIGLFYLIFYSCLAGFFAAMMAGFFQTMDDKVPSLTRMYSLIKQNPGMGFRPMAKVESTLVSFYNNSNDTFTNHIKNMVEFLTAEGYLDEQGDVVPGDNNLKFSLDSIENNQCLYHPQDFNNSFGYLQATPCVLLKLNRVFYWIPEALNVTDSGTDLYEEAKKAMQQQQQQQEPEWEPDSNYVGVSCEGENDGDIDNLGPVDFYPKKGFPTSFYPYENQDGYRPPIVFARFPQIKKGVVIQVWCKAWAKNIKHHKNDKGGSVHFEIMVDANE